MVVILALAGVPLVITARCDPYDGTIDIFRDDDDYHHGFVGLAIEDIFQDDCLFHHCHHHYDYYYDEVVIFD